MDNCPYCGAPGSFREAVDGCCYVCGMVLPEAAGGSQGAQSPAEATMATVAPVASPSAPTAPATSTATIDDMPEPPAIQLIQPRNLGPEYARRVTAAWQATKSPFRNPRETLNSSSTMSGDADDLLIGSRTVGSVDEQRRADYELSELIGEGNMGTVWSAKQASLDREVALKMPKPGAGGSLGRQQFISEVVVTGQLDHPNIVPIYDLARDESGQLFYAMKRVEGRPWDECMHEPGRTRLDNIEILMKVCDAIRFAHDRGVIHRDIKPQNIMVGKYGEVAVMDWGIALRMDADARMTGVTKLSPAGTPAYMAPEMATANAGDIGQHTDVYLLGAVLYEIITREPPHPPPKDSHERLVQQNACLLMAARNVITPAQETGELVDIAYKAMATDISQRYQTVEEFQNAIREYYSHAESIALAERGEAHLAHALELKNGVYEDFAKARFAFGEALQLWPDNSKARSGLEQATLAYASTALERGDYALGLSLLDRGNPQHTELVKKLTAAQRRSQRNRFVAYASAAAAACFLVLGIGVSSFFAVGESIAKNEAKASEGRALEARDAEKKQREIADAAKLAAIDARNQEEKAKNDALEAKEAALLAKDAETAAKDAALKAKDAETQARLLAQQASYRSEVGIAAEEVQRNAFDAARDILVDQQRNDTQASLRNWEWGHLMHLAKNPSVAQFPIEGAARVESVALSPDQKWIAAGTDDGDVHVWWRPDPNKPALQLPVPAKEHTGPVSALAISNDNRMLVTAAGKEVRFWELPEGDPGQGLKAIGNALQYSSPILSVAFSPKDEAVLTSAADATAQLWSRDEPDQPTRILAGHLTGPVWQARFSPDGRQIVTAGEDESVRLWEAATGDELRKLEGHRGPVYAAEFSPDGKFVVSGGRDRRLLVWELQTAEEASSRREAIENRLASRAEPAQNNGLAQLGEHGAPIRSISFAPDGKIVFSASQDNSVCVWDVGQGLSKGQLKKTLRGHGGWVRSCDAAVDGRHVLSGSYDGRVYLWDWQNYAFPRVLRPESERSLSDMRFTSAAVSPDANWIATAAESGAVTVWNMHDPLNPVSQLLTEGHDWQATTGAYFNSGRRLLTSGGDNSTLVWDTQRGNQLVRVGGWNVVGGSGWRGVATASRHGRWFATGSDDTAVLARLWDAETGKLVVAFVAPQEEQAAGGEGSEATAIAFAPDDATIFVGDQWGNCRLFNTSDGALRRSFSGHAGKISGAAFLPDGRLLTASSDGKVAKWDVNADQPAPEPELELSHGGRVVAMDISSDGALIITASDSEDVEAVLRVWNVGSGELVHSLSLSEVTGGQEITDQADEGDKRVSIRSVAMHPNQPRALVTVFDPSSSTYQVGNWQWNSGQNSFELISTRLRDTSMAVYAPDREGGVLTVGGRGARLRLANQVVMSYRPQLGVLSVSFSPDSRSLACAGSDGSIKVWQYEVATSRWLPEQKLTGGHEGAVNSVAFHPLHDDTLLTAGDDGVAKLWSRDANGWSVVVTLGEKGRQESVRQAIFTPPDEGGTVQILTASNDDAEGHLRSWSLAGELLSERSHAGRTHCVAISPDQKWIVSGVGSDAWVWERATPEAPPKQKLAGHSADVAALAFSPDGLRLFTGGRDFNVKLWDTKPWQAATADGSQSSSRELLTLEGHTDGVTSISFLKSPNYPSLVTAGADGQAILWPSVDWHQ